MISVVIPTYNGLEHLQSCFDSLINQQINSGKCIIGVDICIVLVDNGSSDDTIKYVNKNYPGVEIIKLNQNYGFAKAVNEGIKYSLKKDDVTHILLLNNDIECESDFLDNMLKGFVNVNVGSVASKMLNFYNRDKIDDVGDFLKLYGSPFARGHAETDNGQYDTPGFIFGACAGAALYKRDVFDKAGFFDEDFFAYYEDVDFSLRLRMFGFLCYFNPKAVCYHKRGATSSYNSGYQLMLCEQNLVSLRIKNYPLSVYLKYQPMFAAARLKRYLRFFWDKQYDLFFSAFKGYINGLKMVPKSIRKRTKLLNTVNISAKDFEKLFL